MTVGNPFVRLDLFLRSVRKNEVRSYFEMWPSDFNVALELMVNPDYDKAWRAAGVVRLCMKKNDDRLGGFVSRINSVLPVIRNNGHLRELLCVLDKMKIEEKEEGVLFDHCFRLWSNRGNVVSVRYNALKLMIKIARRHPELTDEIKSVTGSDYVYGLSDVVKKSIGRQLKKIEDL